MHTELIAGSGLTASQDTKGEIWCRGVHAQKIPEPTYNVHCVSDAETTCDVYQIGDIGAFRPLGTKNVIRMMMIFLSFVMMMMMMMMSVMINFRLLQRSLYKTRELWRYTTYRWATKCCQPVTAFKLSSRSPTCTEPSHLPFYRSTLANHRKRRWSSATNSCSSWKGEQTLFQLSLLKSAT
jgi:hypothetical protein